MRLRSATFLFILLTLLLACQRIGGQEDAPSTDAPPSTDVEALAQLITLPYEPERAIWQVQQQGEPGLGPTDFTLTAVLNYDEATMDQLRAQLENVAPLNPLRVEATFFEEWYPASVQGSFTQEGESNQWLLSVPRYAPDLFAKQSFINGYFFITADGRSIFLSLFTT
jgi:hypothetical protein